jgi:hypothetical protein
MARSIWIGTLFQEILNKIKVGHIARAAACIVQGRSALYRYSSVDVGAVYNKLFRKDELVHMGRIVERICQISQMVEQSILLVSLHYVGMRLTNSSITKVDYLAAKASLSWRSEQESANFEAKGIPELA